MDETLEERVERYRRMADSTRDLAARSDDPDIRRAYLDLADKWERLARQNALAAPGLLDGAARLPLRRKVHDREDVQA